MYDYVLFDLDGTISDSSLGITKGIQIALRSLGIEEPLDNLRKFIGPPLTYSFSKFYDFDEEQTDRAIKAYRDYYSKIGLFENTAYEGIDALLKKVKESGRKIAVATSKPAVFSRQILDKFGLLKYFDIVSGATLEGDGEPPRASKTDVVEYALMQFGNPDKSKVVLVGDTKFDAEGAATVGIDCIGVLYGFGTRETLEAAGVKHIAPTIEDIFQYL